MPTIIRHPAPRTVALEVATLVLLTLSPLAWAQVCTAPSDTYPNVQAALDDVACATVVVAPGEHEGDLRIERAVNLVGAGMNATVLRGTGSGSAVEITDGPVVIADLTITGGSANEGGGINAERVADGTRISAIRVRLTGNTAPAGGAAVDTGQSRFRLVDSLVDRNTGGGLVSEIVAIDGNVVVERSRFFGNTRGLVVQAVSLTLRDSVVTGNRAATGIVSLGEGSVERTTVSNNVSTASDFVCGGITMSETGTIVDSTIADNEGPGGGVCHTDVGLLTITNTTISGNVGTRFAGGVSHSDRDFGSDTILDHVTLVENAGSIADSIGMFAGQVRLRATIVAGASGSLDDCFSGFGDIASFGSNLAADASCNLLRGSDQVSVADIGLAPLADNGGGTRTHALLPGSPAIDAVASDNCPATDQRGVSRPQGEACDVGAFEADAAL